MDMSIVIACKDRQANIAYCAASIAGCMPAPTTYIVDFGSAVPIATFIKYPNAHIIRVDRKTGFFHKARALNIGIKEVRTKFLCVTDADQIFQDNFFNIAYDHLVKDESKFLMCKTHFLNAIPRGFTLKDVHAKYSYLIDLCKKEELRFLGDGNCNATLTQWFTKVQGYDENYIGYGAEDSDLVFRALKSGLNRTWLETETSMIHLPHEQLGEYYDKKYKAANKARFNQSIKQPNPHLIANPNGVWGVR